jgi:hypothetical protein
MSCARLSNKPFLFRSFTGLEISEFNDYSILLCGFGKTLKSY